MIHEGIGMNNLGYTVILQSGITAKRAFVAETFIQQLATLLGISPERITITNEKSLDGDRYQITFDFGGFLIGVPVYLDNAGNVHEESG